jgi:parallel beta-helix repeat protein
MLVLLVTNILVLAVKIQPVRAIGTITINANGSITPPEAPISSADNITYTLTGTISITDQAGVFIERDNIVLDGAGCGVVYAGSGIAIGAAVYLINRRHVTINGLTIQRFAEGILLDASSDNTLSGNYVVAPDAGIFFSHSDNNVLSGNYLENCGSGIEFDSSSSDNTLSGNIVYGSNNNGIHLDSSYNTLSGNTFSHNRIGITLGGGSYSNTLSGNTFTDSTLYGIYIQSSSNNLIYHNSFVNYANAVTDGSANVWDNGYPSGGNRWGDYTARYPSAAEIDNSGLGDTPYVIDANNKDNYPLMPMPTYSVAINAHCNTQGIDLAVPFTKDGSAIGEFFTTPCTFSLSGSHTFTVPSADASGDPFLQWSTGQTSTTVTVSSAGTYTAYSQAPPPAYHDIALTNLTLSRTIVGQGYLLPINLTVTNPGNYLETFNITGYANETIGVELQNIALSSGNSATITSLWNTTDFAYGNYTLRACAWPVNGEANTQNNNCTGDQLTITILGDIDGNFKVQLQDLVLLAQAYGSKPPDSNWNLYADIEGNGTVGLSDLVALAQHYGQHYP